MSDTREPSFVTRKEYNIERDKLLEQNSAMDRRITVLETYWQNWGEIPKTIQEISTTMALMQREITTLTNRIEGMDGKFERFAREKEKQDVEQSEKLSEIDNKSKIDIMEWVKSNWFKLVVGLGILSLVVKDLVIIK